MINWLLSKLGLAGNIQMLGVVVAACIAIGGIGGWYTCSKFNTAAEVQELIELQHERNRLEERLRDKENELIYAKANIRTIIKEVKHNVPIYINRNDCSITPDGVRGINKVLSGGTAE